MIELNKDNIDVKSELPIGLGFSLAADEKAMEHFSNMSEEEKRQIIEASRAIKSKKAMETFVSKIGEL